MKKLMMSLVLIALTPITAALAGPSITGAR
jgi:hypothetical protein